MPVASSFACCMLQVGKKNRVVGATLMNQDSSRSHSIFSITIEATERFNSADPGEHAPGQPMAGCAEGNSLLEACACKDTVCGTVAPCSACTLQDDCVSHAAQHCCLNSLHARDLLPAVCCRVAVMLL